MAPSSPDAPCSNGQTTSTIPPERSPRRLASTSRSTTVHPPSRSASATRRPDRRDTSLSCDSPPARTRTRGARFIGELRPRGVPSCQVGAGSGYARVSSPRGPRPALGPQGGQELRLRLHDSGKSPDALTDPLRGRVAVGQPEGLPPLAVRVEGGPRY